MSRHAVACIRALIAAYEMRRVYGTSHPGGQEQVRRCAELAAQTLADAALMSIVITESGIVVNDQPVDEPWARNALFLSHLRERGVQAIRFARGVNQAEIEWLVSSGGLGASAASPRGLIQVGGIRIAASARDSGHDVISAAEARRNLRRAWDVVLGGRDDRQSVTSMTNRILTATVSNRAGLIKLAELKGHDEYTFIHVTNVAILASALGEAVGLRADDLRGLTEAALLHDIGKWMLPKRILTKAGQLTDEERLAVQMHPITGAKILAASPGITNLSIVAAFEHHQRIDGRGYPQTARGRPPSLLSQIVHVADVFDALRSDRPYRAGLPVEKCLEIMERDSGQAFESALFEAFQQSVLKRLASAGETERPAIREAA
jgi:HD-GYP domain-containing protein (c-di-GMP phosphodiesterase class II)